MDGYRELRTHTERRGGGDESEILLEKIVRLKHVGLLTVNVGSYCKAICSCAWRDVESIAKCRQ